MSDQRMREAARHAPGSLEELAWGLRTGALRPKSHAPRDWSPTARQIFMAVDAVGLDWSATSVIAAWARRHPKWEAWVMSGGRRGRHLTHAQYGRVSSRLLRWSRFVLDAAGEEIHNPDPRLREAV